MVKNVIILLLASALAALLWVNRHSSTPPAEVPVVITTAPAPIVPQPLPPAPTPAVPAPPPPAPLTPEPPPKHPITQLLDEARTKPGLEGAAIGFCLLDEQGKIIVEQQSRTAFIPASSLKTVTTATALEKWGPDHRIETRLMASAPIQQGVIKGDVVIVGGADPMLKLTDLQSWVKTLKERGLKRITGRILGDGRLFSGSIYDDFWNWGDIGNGYGSSVAGLNLEHNRFIALFNPADAVGKPAIWLGAQPDVPGITWRNETITGEKGSGDGVVIHGGERARVIHLRGTVPMGRPTFHVLGAVPDPELFAAHWFREALLEAEIEVAGKAAPVGDVKAGEIELLKHHSPPLKDIITSIHATSDNHETECLFRLLGVQEGKSPDQVVREHWQASGLEFQGLRMEDGCGLARADFITPHDLAMLQYLVGIGRQGVVYRESLLTKEHLRWKGGAMSGVRSTTGFLTTKSGRELAFAYMVNHYADSGAVSALREALLKAMGDL
ncbi:D-alanyl-D-alanine carboxypeptidase/D-alanyl-D-alanine endopeptidase [Brevifollis gellanilyticus]|uniref:D-alanyl-D-alanine carboxypeptidase n=1 Tax=Brevifollis gellanilyticus TaxID=748831 RepID=A0A512MGX0_9BACT|nr:D-alanyl-D-alanine carboxypeptidase/D-alanyl-D-alanine-endopeptidase [Brevifollis gellanilyticus]GEP45969.1 D-alanyl-D-alanine carboxypeptidase [Brevifollis gellanilyticus]